MIETYPFFPNNKQSKLFKCIKVASTPNPYINLDLRDCYSYQWIGKGDAFHYRYKNGKFTAIKLD